MSTNIPQVAINDIGNEEEFLKAVDETIKYFNDGDLVSGRLLRLITMRFCSTSVTRPKASFPPASSPSSMTLTPAKS